MGETKTYNVTVEESSSTSIEDKNKSFSKNNWTLDNKIALFSLFTAITAAVVTSITCAVMVRNNRIIDTANLLTIYNAIQTRLDAYTSINDEVGVMQSMYKEQKIEDYQPLELLKNKRTDVIYSFLNTFEFACQQYQYNKLDKKAFRIFFDDDVFKGILAEFKFRIKIGNYPYIEKICEEWGWTIF